MIIASLILTATIHVSGMVGTTTIECWAVPASWSYCTDGMDAVYYTGE